MPPAIPMMRAVFVSPMPMLTAHSGRMTERAARMPPMSAAPDPSLPSTPRLFQIVRKRPCTSAPTNASPSVGALPRRESPNVADGSLSSSRITAAPRHPMTCTKKTADVEPVTWMTPAAMNGPMNSPRRNVPPREDSARAR